MTTHKKTLLLSTILLASSFSYSETLTASKSGDWSDPATWGSADKTPTATDSVKFSDGVVVDLTTAATITGVTWTNNNTASATLNVRGENASLTATGTSQLWYNNRLNINITEGASATFSNIAWGSGGYNNITVNNSTFSGAFAEMRGSSVNEGSLFLIENKSTATALGAWTLNSAAEHKMTLQINDSILDMNGKALGVAASGSNSVSKLIIENGAQVNNISGSFVVSSGSAASAHGIAEISGSTFTTTAASTLRSTAGKSELILKDQTNFTSASIWLEANGGAAYITVKSGSKFSTDTVNIKNIANSINAIQIFGKDSSLKTKGNFYVGDSDITKTNAQSSITFGGFDESGKFVAADAKAIDAGYEVFVSKTGSLNYLLGASNASETVDRTKVIFSGLYFKAITGEINVDLSNVSGLAEGEYYFALFTSTSNQSIGSYEDYADILNVTDGEFAKFQDYFIKDSTFYIIANVIPEPSTYAAIAGALALALAFYRRKK